MKNLLYKELKLSINRFLFIFPFLLALLLLIPQWIFLIVFSYFFWISVSQIYGAYNSQQDTSFCSMLPVTKKDIVMSKIYSFFIVEGIHILTGLIMVLVHIQLYGSVNFLLDLNIAFIGIVFVMYSIFNIVFLPLYFKTSYYYGRPVIYGIVVTFIYGFIMEYGVLRFAAFRKAFEGKTSTQLMVLGVAILITFGLNFIAVRRSVSNFESIQ